MAACFRVGVLVIGSLYWEDTAARNRWRRRLLKKAAARVRLPIRYGRESRKWGNTHTMVFSRLCYRHRALGIGYVFPCSNLIRRWDDLRRQVDGLAVAEGLTDSHGGWQNWGVVGLLKNPTTALLDPLVQPWQEYFLQRTSGSAVFDRHAKSEAAIVGKDGLLMLEWPKLTSRKRCALDLLLATSTVPTLTASRYPSARTIANAYCRADRPEYFIRNIKAGIQTFQDSVIAKYLIRARPEWTEDLRGFVQSKR